MLKRTNWERRRLRRPGFPIQAVTLPGLSRVPNAPERTRRPRSQAKRAPCVVTSGTLPLNDIWEENHSGRMIAARLPFLVIRRDSGRPPFVRRGPRPPIVRRVA